MREDADGAQARLRERRKDGLVLGAQIGVVGLGLLLGVWVRMAALIGVVMLLLMWSSLLWPANAPGVDEHIIYALALFGVALSDEHQVWGLRGRWLKTSFAKRLSILR